MNDNEIDLKELVLKLYSYKYWVVGSLILALGLAFLYIRYTPKIYQVEASVLVESKQGTPPASLIFGSDFFDAGREIANELIILKSYPLLAKTVRDLDLRLTYYRSTEALERRIEIYGDELPFIVNIDTLPENRDRGGYYKIEFVQGVFNVVNEASGVRKDGVGADEKFEINGFQMSISRNPTFRSKPNQEIEYMFNISSLMSMVNLYKAKIAVGLKAEKSSVVELGISGDIIEKELRFLSKHLDNYLRQNLKEKNRVANRTVQFINQELVSIKDSLKIVERKLELFKSQNKFSNLQTEGEKIFELLLTLEAEKAGAMLEAKYIDHLSQYMANNGEDDKQLISPASFGIQNDELNSTTLRLSALTQRLQKLESSKNQNIDLVAELRKEIAFLTKRLRSFVNTEKEKNTIILNDLNYRIGAIESTLSGLPNSEIALLNIERLHKLSESMYILLMEKKAEAEISKSSNTPDYKIVEDARLVSRTPVKPNTTFIYMIAIFLGIIAPLVFLLGRDFFNDTIQSREDVARLTSVPFLGVVISARDRSLDFIKQSPKSRLSESFRSIKSNLRFMGHGNSKVILVTSNLPGEGKTFVSSNLGVALSSSESKVLIIGSDMRKPELHNVFDSSNEMGLSGYLSGMYPKEEVIIASRIENVDLIPSGPIPPNPAELLEGIRFADLIEECKKDYSHIIIDTPPFGLVSEPEYAYELADVNLIIVRSGKTTKRQVAEIEKEATKFSDQKFGIILNDFNFRKGSYGNGYGYGADAGGYYE